MSRSGTFLCFTNIPLDSLQPGRNQDNPGQTGTSGHGKRARFVKRSNTLWTPWQQLHFGGSVKPKARRAISQTQNTFDHSGYEPLPLKYLPLNLDVLVSTVEPSSLDVLIWSRAAVWCLPGNSEHSLTCQGEAGSEIWFWHVRFYLQHDHVMCAFVKKKEEEGKTSQSLHHRPGLGPAVHAWLSQQHYGGTCQMFNHSWL